MIRVLMRRIEFWPDYGGDLLFTESGERVPLDSLGLSDELRSEAARWVEAYDDSKLPWETTSDPAWLADGRRLFGSLRAQLAKQGIELIPGEDYWERAQAFPD